MFLPYVSIAILNSRITPARFLSSSVISVWHSSTSKHSFLKYPSISFCFLSIFPISCSRFVLAPLHSTASLFSLIADPLLAGIKGFFEGWKERFGNIADIFTDDESSPWEKVKGIAKELVLGIIEGPSNIIKGWITELSTNEKFLEIKEKFTSWFSDVGDTIGNWMWNLLPEPLQKGIQYLGFGKDREVKESTTPNPKDLGYHTNTDFSKVNQPVPAGTGSVQEIGNKYSRFYGVNDAIIYKDGNIIQPSPDDHIIATKDRPYVETRAEREMMNQVNNQYFQPKESQESLKKFDTMITLLNRVAQGIEKGVGGTIIQNTMGQGFSFDSLRMGT